MKVVKSHFTLFLLVLQMSPLQTDGCISSSLKIFPLSFTFSLLSGTNCSSSFPWFLPVHSPEAASGHPAQHWAVAHPLGRQWQLGRSEEPFHSHYLTWTNNKGCLVCWGSLTADHWTLTLMGEVVLPRSPAELCFLPSYPASKVCLSQQHLLKSIL